MEQRTKRRSYTVPTGSEVLALRAAKRDRDRLRRCLRHIARLSHEYGSRKDYRAVVLDCVRAALRGDQPPPRKRGE